MLGSHSLLLTLCAVLCSSCWAGATGVGKSTLESGDTYEGEWLDGMQHGDGTLTFTNGDVFEGEFVNNMKHG